MPAARRIIQTIPASEMRALHRAAILELIRSTGGISRAQIGAALEIRRQVVKQVVEDLLAEGVILETGQKEAGGGRKRSILQFNGANHLMIGVDLGGTKVYGAMANLNGAILHEAAFEHHHTRSEESFTLVCRVIDTLLRHAQDAALPVRGIGVGVPGLVQPGVGSVSLAPALEWHDFPLKERLTGQYPYPVIGENDVKLAALGELWFGVAPGVSNLALLAVGTGIGAGMVIGGAVYRGAHHMAGEVGYFLPRRDQLGKAYPGFGALEQLASGSGIAELGRLALQGQRPDQELADLTAEEVFAAARRAEPWAQAVLEEAADYLAQLAAAIALILDPEIIVLGGGVGKSADLLIPAITQRLEGAIPTPLQIQASRLGYRAAIMGAIVHLLRLTSSYSMIR